MLGMRSKASHQNENMTVNVKDHGEGVISVCDTNLLGKVLEEGEIYLKVSEVFYKGIEMEVTKAEKFLLIARHLNLLGKESVGIAVKLGMVSQESTIIIAGVPHAQIYTVE